MYVYNNTSDPNTNTTACTIGDVVVHVPHPTHDYSDPNRTQSQHVIHRNVARQVLYSDIYSGIVEDGDSGDGLGGSTSSNSTSNNRSNKTFVVKAAGSKTTTSNSNSATNSNTNSNSANDADADADAESQSQVDLESDMNMVELDSFILSNEEQQKRYVRVGLLVV